MKDTKSSTKDNSSNGQSKELRHSKPDALKKTTQEKPKIKEKQSTFLPTLEKISDKKFSKPSKLTSVSSNASAKSPVVASKTSSKGKTAESPLPRETDSFSVFEAMQKEFETSNFAATRQHSASPEKEGRSSFML